MKQLQHDDMSITDTWAGTVTGFGCFREATDKQKKFANKLGLNLEGVPQNVAEAMMEYFILTEFKGKMGKLATRKQVAFGRKFNREFSCMPSSIAFAYIRNILWELNFIIIEQQQLEPGVWTENIFNGEKRQISGIDKDGLVKFTDMRRPFRYARSLLRCAAPAQSEPDLARNPFAEQTHEQLRARLFRCIMLNADKTV